MTDVELFIQNFKWWEGTKKKKERERKYADSSSGQEVPEANSSRFFSSLDWSPQVSFPIDALSQLVITVFFHFSSFLYFSSFPPSSSPCALVVFQISISLPLCLKTPAASLPGLLSCSPLDSSQNFKNGEKKCSSVCVCLTYSVCVFHSLFSLSHALFSDVFWLSLLRVCFCFCVCVNLWATPVQLTSERDKLKEAEKLLSESAAKVGDLQREVLCYSYVPAMSSLLPPQACQFHSYITLAWLWT